MDEYEQVVVKLFEHCGFTYDPGPPRKPNESWYIEVVEIPYAHLEKKMIPGYWVRCVALHLYDTRRACDHVSEYMRHIPAFLLRGKSAVTAEWLEDMPSIDVSDELRFHVFCFLTVSETVRDKIRGNRDDMMPHLVPISTMHRYKPRLAVEDLSPKLAKRGHLSESDAVWVMQQLSLLDMHCRRTRNAIKRLVSEPDAPAEQLVQRFANVQAAMLDLARLLIEADYAVDTWEKCVG